MATNNWTFIIAAYTVAWLGVLGYWGFVHRAVRRARALYDRAVEVPAKSAVTSR